MHCCIFRTRWCQTMDFFPVTGICRAGHVFTEIARLDIPRQKHLLIRYVWRLGPPHKIYQQKPSNSHTFSSGSMNTWMCLGMMFTPWRLTWNITIEVSKIIFLSKWVIFRFHVNLPWCKGLKVSQQASNVVSRSALGDFGDPITWFHTITAEPVNHGCFLLTTVKNPPNV